MWLSAINSKTGGDRHCYTDPSGIPPIAFNGSKDIRDTEEYKKARGKWDKEMHRFFESNLQNIKDSQYLPH